MKNLISLVMMVALIGLISTPVSGQKLTGNPPKGEKTFVATVGDSVSGSSDFYFILEENKTVLQGKNPKKYPGGTMVLCIYDASGKVVIVALVRDGGELPGSATGTEGLPKGVKLEMEITQKSIPSVGGRTTWVVTKGGQTKIWTKGIERLGYVNNSDLGKAGSRVFLVETNGTPSRDGTFPECIIYMENKKRFYRFQTDKIIKEGTTLQSVQ